MYNLNIHGKRVYKVLVPEVYDELTQEQFVEITRIKLIRGLTDEELLVSCLWAVCKKQVNKSIFWDMPGELATNTATECLSWLLEAPVTNINLVDSVTLRKGLIFKETFIGAGNDLNNLTAGQMAVAEITANGYVETTDIDLLNLHVAVLFYNDAKNGLDPVALDKFQKRIAALPFHFKFAVLSAYQAVRKTLSEKYPYLFSGQEKGRKEDDSKMWAQLFSSIAKNGPQEVDKVKRTLAFTVLEWLDANAKEAKEMEERMRKNR
jgi:hypothetical protein